MTPAQRTLQQLCIQAHEREPATAEQYLGLVVDVSQPPLADALGAAMAEVGILPRHDPAAEALCFVGLVSEAQALAVISSVGTGKLAGVTAPEPGFFVCVVADDHGLRTLRRSTVEFLHASPDEDDGESDSEQPSEEGLELLSDATETLWDLYLQAVPQNPDLADTHIGLVIDCSYPDLVSAMVLAEFEPPTSEEIASGATLHIEFCPEDELHDLLWEIGFTDRIASMIAPCPGNIRVLIADGTGVSRFTTSLADFLHPPHSPGCKHYEKPS